MFKKYYMVLATLNAARYNVVINGDWTEWVHAQTAAGAVVLIERITPLTKKQYLRMRDVAAISKPKTKKPAGGEHE